MPFAGLNIDGIDVAELNALLRLHFGMSRNESSLKMVYLREIDSPRLSLEFDKKGNVRSATRHNGLDDQEITEINEKIDSELRQTNGIYVFRDYLFYTVAVDRAHRCADIFQIFPVPPGAAKPNTAISSHPFVIEVSIPSSSDPFTNLSRGSLKSKHIKNVLALLLQFSVKSYGESTERVWVLDNPSENQPVSLRQVMYACSNPDWKSDRFTDISSFPKPRMSPPSEYYAKYGISGDEGLELPSNLDDQFRQYFALEGKCRQRFERAAYWYNHAYQVWTLSKSASYMALVTAVECMIDAVSADQLCPTCGKAPTDGPTKQFRSFIERYVPGSSHVDSVKGDLYGIRSRMAHGSRLMADDLGGWAYPRYADESHMHRQLTRLVQFALVNWLASAAT